MLRVWQYCHEGGDQGLEVFATNSTPTETAPNSLQPVMRCSLRQPSSIPWGQTPLVRYRTKEWPHTSQLNALDDTAYSPSSSFPGLLPTHPTSHWPRSALEVQTSHIIIILTLLSTLPHLTPFPCLPVTSDSYIALWNSWFADGICLSRFSEYLLLLPLTETWLFLSNGTWLCYEFLAGIQKLTGFLLRASHEMHMILFYLTMPQDLYVE